MQISPNLRLVPYLAAAWKNAFALVLKLFFPMIIIVSAFTL